MRIVEIGRRLMYHAAGLNNQGDLNWKPPAGGFMDFL